MTGVWASAASVVWARERRRAEGRRAQRGVGMLEGDYVGEILFFVREEVRR